MVHKRILSLVPTVADGGTCSRTSTSTSTETFHFKRSKTDDVPNTNIIKPTYIISSITSCRIYVQHILKRKKLLVTSIAASICFVFIFWCAWIVCFCTAPFYIGIMDDETYHSPPRLKLKTIQECIDVTNTTTFDQEAGNDIEEIWSDIDNITSLHPNTKVSGGIFLYPRQSMFLIHLINTIMQSNNNNNHKNTNNSHLSNSNANINREQPFRICETGFGAGHSAALFLSSNPNVQVITFDKFDRSYQLPVLQYIKKQQVFQDRIVHIAGNSCHTVPKYLSKYQYQQQQQQQQQQKNVDILICDFLHGSSLCPSDNMDLVKYATCGTILTSTAMHSLNNGNVYFGRNGQWTKLRKQECITNIKCFREDSTTLEKSYVFASANNSISHKFCVSVVTGKCNENNEDGINDSTSAKCQSKIRVTKEAMMRFCLNNMIEVPPLSW